MTTNRATIGLCAGLLWLTACQSESLAAPPAPMGPVATPGAGPDTGPSTPVAPSDAELLGGLPLPPGAKIHPEQSLIIGSGDNWFGRVDLDVGRDVTAAYNFFLSQFPQQGWTVQSAVRSKTSILVFTRAGRSATIEFQETKLVGGAQVMLTMSPLQGGGR